MLRQEDQMLVRLLAAGRGETPPEEALQPGDIVWIQARIGRVEREGRWARVHLIKLNGYETHAQLRLHVSFLHPDFWNGLRRWCTRQRTRLFRRPL